MYPIPPRNSLLIALVGCESALLSLKAIVRSVTACSSCRHDKLQFYPLQLTQAILYLYIYRRSFSPYYYLSIFLTNTFPFVMNIRAWEAIIFDSGARQHQYLNITARKVKLIYKALESTLELTLVLSGSWGISTNFTDRKSVV